MQGAEERRLRRIEQYAQACREPQGRTRGAIEGNAALLLSQDRESFDFARDREPFDFAQDRELVERLVEWQMMP